MKKYLNALHRRPAHHKRRISLHAAGVITALLFAGWITTLGVRLSQNSGSPATSGSGQGLAAVAAAGSDLSSQLSQFPAAPGSAGSGTQSGATSQASTSAPATVLYSAPSTQGGAGSSGVSGGYGSTQ